VVDVADSNVGVSDDGACVTLSNSANDSKDCFFEVNNERQMRYTASCATDSPAIHSQDLNKITTGSATGAQQ
jgi:hypothetical protein